MKVVIQLTEEEEIKALPVLVRHWPGMMLRDGTYLLDGEAVRKLRDAGVEFTELEKEADTGNSQ